MSRKSANLTPVTIIALYFIALQVGLVIAIADMRLGQYVPLYRGSRNGVLWPLAS